MICIIVPVKSLKNTKSRLSDLLSINERITLSLYLLEDLLSIIDKFTIFETIVVGSDDEVKSITNRFNARFIQDENKGVNHAVKLVDEYVKDFDASLIVPIDLILLESIDLIILYDIARDIKNGIVITPSNRLDGTNILLRKPSLIIDTYYDMDSYLLHLNKALENGLEVRILLNNRITHDLDNLNDIEYVKNINRKKKSLEYLKSIL